MATGETNKRKRNNNANKRRKKSKPNNPPQRKKNWIESCSESINRIPVGSTAPICCVVSRVELEEGQLLPLGDCAAVTADANEALVTNVDAGEVSAAGQEAPNKDDATQTDDTTEVISSAHESQDKVAAEAEHDTKDDPSKQIALLKTVDASDAPFKICNTIQVNGEENKIFIPVKRDASANGPTQWQLKQKSKKFPSNNHNHHLPNGDNGDGIPNPHPKHLVPDKFWAQRKRLFTKYDEGIQIEYGEMWYSVTPEVIAGHVADKMIKMVDDVRMKMSDGDKKKDEIVVLDAFCGCGGNAIAFAKKNNVKVIAVDNDLNRLRMAANNAKVYGIDPNKIVFVHADVVDALRSYSKGSRCIDSTPPEVSMEASGYRIGGLELLPDTIDAIFLSPPWGGMGYENNGAFDPISSITIESKHQDGEITKTNGGELFNMTAGAVFSGKEGVVAYFLPRNVDGIKLGQIAVASDINHGCFELEQNVVNGKVKTVTAFFGGCLTK